jgi:hypothetical protein
MKSLILDHFAVILQQVHTELQVLSPVDVGSHHIVVRPVKQDLPKKLDALSFCNIGLGLHQYCVVSREEKIKVSHQIMSHEALVLRENFLEKLCELPSSGAKAGILVP